MLERKLDYLFSKVTGHAHNIERSTDMLRQMERIGLPDTAVNRQLMSKHFQDVLNNASHVAGSGRGGTTIRESLLMGPNGSVKVRSFWDGGTLRTFLLEGKKGTDLFFAVRCATRAGARGVAWQKTFAVYGLGLLYEVTGSVVRYYRYDQAGSTVALTDAAGSVVTDRMGYAPFGTLVVRKGTTTTPYLSGGQFGVKTNYDISKNGLEIEDFTGNSALSVKQDVYATVLTNTIGGLI